MRQILTMESRFEITSTIPLLLQETELTKCTSHLRLNFWWCHLTHIQQTFSNSILHRTRSLQWFKMCPDLDNEMDSLQQIPKGFQQNLFIKIFSPEYDRNPCMIKYLPRNFHDFFQDFHCILYFAFFIFFSKIFSKICS